MAASIRDIKQKVVATKKTSQITNAMNMVSASKLKGAQKATESFRPYMQRIEEIICADKIIRPAYLSIMEEN